MSSRIMRLVKKTSEYERKSFDYGATILSILECGHEVATKRSAGYAIKRRCRSCESLRDGAIEIRYNKSNLTKTKTTWDNNTQLPLRETKVWDGINYEF